MSVVRAVFKRNLAAFFGNPAGYVFIILFVGFTAFFAFVAEGFFAANQANLNFLTIEMPWLLMIFVSAVTMTTWAEEKKLGTDELLFTLPGSDFQVVVGKFLADLAVITAALAFTFTHVLILFHLGDPDLGLLFATYLGYWLLGAAFIATGMFASSLTNNITVGFIFGILFCAIFAFAHKAALLFPGQLGSGINSFAAISHLESFSRGVVAFKDLIYFISIVVVMIYLNSIVLSRRRWPGGYAVSLKNSPWFNTTLRIVAVVIIVISMNVLISRFLGARMDITEERLSSLSEETDQILSELSEDKPVYIQAWISEEMPPGYAEKRDRVLGLLKEYDERGGDALRVKIYRPERFSEEARSAKANYNIQPVPVFTQEEGESSSDEIFLGAAFTCGVEEMVIPFFHPGIPVEYELTRTIRVVSKADRPKVGVIDNELKLLGGFDFQTRSRSNPWQVVDELRKQYDVESIRADAPIPDNVDVIFSALPSLFKEPDLKNLVDAIRSGKPTILLMDPLPLSALPLSPSLPRPSPQSNPFMQQQQRSEPKCDLNRLLNVLGVRWMKDTIVWDTGNPHPQLRHLSPEFVFITQQMSQEGGFSAEDVITSGLQELLAFFPGSLARSATMNSNLTFEPLLRTSMMTSGMIRWHDCVTQTFMGPQLTPLEQLKRLPRRISPQDYILAARIKGELVVEKKAEEAKEAEEGEEAEKEEIPAEPETVNIDVILVADLDLISDQFFEIRKGRFLQFDNVPFVLNCVDSLAGDDSYISLRKRRSKIRTLTRIEGLYNEFMQMKLSEESKADLEAQGKLAEAQASFDEKMRAVEDRTDLDMRTKDIMLASVKRREEQILSAKKDKIDEEKNRMIEESRYTMEREKRSIRVQKKWMGVVFPIIPPLVIAIVILFRRLVRENRGAAKTRLLRD